MKKFKKMRPNKLVIAILATFVLFNYNCQEDEASENSGDKNKVQFGMKMTDARTKQLTESLIQNLLVFKN